MSILIRPDGDIIADFVCSVHAASYIPPETLQGSLAPGQRYDVLCSDGLNYVVDVEKYNEKTGVGHLHFLWWSRKTDYHGKLTNLYFAKEGSFSKLQGISTQNFYPKLIEETALVELSNQKTENAINNVVTSSSSVKNTNPITRYDNDFLYKPRMSFKSENIYIPTDAEEISQRRSTRGLSRVLNENSQAATSTNDIPPLDLTDASVGEKRTIDDDDENQILKKRTKRKESIADNKSLKTKDMVPQLEEEAVSAELESRSAAEFSAHLKKVLRLDESIKCTDKALGDIKTDSVRMKQLKDILNARRSIDTILMEFLK